MRLRKNLLSLTPDELTVLRSAIRQAQADTSASGYGVLAGIHGWPLPVSCPHHTADLAFLPWHRQYLLAFEGLLRTYEPQVTLPYWDWTADPAPTSDGLPAALRPTMAGGQNTNPLASGPLDLLRTWLASFPAGGVPQEVVNFIGTGPTRRDPGDPDLIHAPQPEGYQLRGLVSAALQETTIELFTDLIEQPHDNLHGYIGGHMAAPETAAFDPVFWLHHANVDRQWALWQLRHPDAIQHPSPDTLTQDLGNHRFGDLLDILSLDYDYEDLAALRAQPEAALEAPATPRLPRLLFRRIQQPGGNELLLRIFASAEAPTLDTPTTGNPAFLGELFLFGTRLKEPSTHAGHGHGHGHGGHGSHGSHGGTRPFARQILLPAGTGVDPASVKVLVTNASGTPVPASNVLLEAPVFEE
jgi:tyrosinase